jgi:hypothetical protein
MKANRNIVQRGQTWKNKETSRVISIIKKASDIRWTTSNGHKIHEGTLIKFYELQP